METDRAPVAGPRRPCRRDRTRQLNCSPQLLRRWGLQVRDGALRVPVTSFVPAVLMGSGLGKNTAR